MEQPNSVPDPYVLILNVTYLSLPRHLSAHVHVNPYITPCMQPFGHPLDIANGSLTYAVQARSNTAMSFTAVGDEHLDPNREFPAATFTTSLYSSAMIAAEQCHDQIVSLQPKFIRGAFRKPCKCAAVHVERNRPCLLFQHGAHTK